MNPTDDTLPSEEWPADDDGQRPHVLSFNSHDPSGAGGLMADAQTLSCVGVHAMAVATGTWVRDSVDVHDHISFDEEVVREQAVAVLEDVPVHVIKVGFCGTAENLRVVAELCADYADAPVVAYMPSLNWWDIDQAEEYLDAFRELVLPQATVLVGSHGTLSSWLLPDWDFHRPPQARDLAKAAADKGVPFVWVTGFAQGHQRIDNQLANAQSILQTETVERLDAVFTGTGDTLSAALAGLLASGADLEAACAEALSFLQGSLAYGFRPGMGNVLPDRLFWAHSGEDESDADAESRDGPNLNPLDHLPISSSKH